MKNKYWKAFLSGFLNPFGRLTYQEMITLPHGEITRRVNAKMAPRRAETDRMMNELNDFVKKENRQRKGK